MEELVKSKYNSYVEESIALAKNTNTILLILSKLYCVKESISNDKI